MSAAGYTGELERALARPDAETLCRQIDAYAADFASDENRWSDASSDEFYGINFCYQDEPEKALAYVTFTADRSNDAEFLNFMGCGPLEDILHDPSPEMLDRIVAEAHKSARFRWMLSAPFEIAIAPRAWDAIAKFRITGPHEEPAVDTFPPRT